MMQNALDAVWVGMMADRHVSNNVNNLNKRRTNKEN